MLNAEEGEGQINKYGNFDGVYGAIQRGVCSKTIIKYLKIHKFLTIFISESGC